MQQRFLITGEDATSAWYVPVSYTTSVDENKFESTAPSAWLTPTSGLTIPYPSGAEWIILNNHETGRALQNYFLLFGDRFPDFLILNICFSAFYRVNYATELWDALAAALLAEDFSGIPELNRAQITDDVLEYAKYDKMTYTQAFTILEFLEKDDSYFSWYAVNTELSSVLDNVGLHTRLGQVMQVNRIKEQFFYFV